MCVCQLLSSLVLLLKILFFWAQLWALFSLLRIRLERERSKVQGYQLRWGIIFEMKTSTYYIYLLNIEYISLHPGSTGCLNFKPKWAETGCWQIKVLSMKKRCKLLQYRFEREKSLKSMSINLDRALFFQMKNISKHLVEMQLNILPQKMPIVRLQLSCWTEEFLLYIYVSNI